MGDVHTGDVIGLPAEVFTAARDIPAPPGFSNLPLRVVCVGREEALGWLRDALGAGAEGAVTRTSAVHGLGGIGKTTLALAYAHRHLDRGDYGLAWWVNAETPDGIERSLADLALRLLPAGTGRAAQHELAAWATTWLQWHPGWLLVFDNAEHPADLEPHLRALQRGHRLVTTRRATGWPRTVPTYPLGTLAPEEATELLCAHAFPDRAPTPRERWETAALAAELGHLPLALDQAGAYLRQHPATTPAAYRRRLPARLDKAADGTDAERTIARIWTQTLHALDRRDPHAVEVLRTLAWLAPDNVPTALLETPGTDNDDLHEALALLAAYSMATVTRDAVGVHRLLQTVLRTTAPAAPDGSPAGRRAAEDALIRALEPLDPTAAASPWDALLPQLIALAETVPAGHRSDRATSRYVAAAQRLLAQGHEARAVPLWEAVLAQYEQDFGDIHPHTLVARGNLAGAYEAAGELDRAIALHRTVLAQCAEVLGDTHPETLTNRNNLAYAYQAAGDLDRAVPLYESALAQREQILGATHPDTLNARNNLAYAYKTAGDLDRAVPLYETTLAQREQILGNTHPDTLATRNNLAGAYQAAGNLERALALYRTVLAQCTEVLGDTHPRTLSTRHNLARAYEVTGSVGRAVALYESTLAQCVRTFGETHPQTLLVRHNLAGAYETAGDVARAVQLFETVLAQYEQVLGDTHSRTLVARHNLAGAYETAEDLERAVPLFETVLAQCEEAYGDVHPQTLTTRHNLAHAYLAAGEVAGAVALYEATLAGREQVLGANHPETLNTRYGLALARLAAGDALG